MLWSDAQLQDPTTHSPEFANEETYLGLVGSYNYNSPTFANIFANVGLL